MTDITSFSSNALSPKANRSTDILLNALFTKEANGKGKKNVIIAIISKFCHQVPDTLKPQNHAPASAKLFQIRLRIRLSYHTAPPYYSS